MEFNEENLTKLIATSITNSAAVKILLGAFLGYVETEDKVKADALKKFFDDKMQFVLEEEIKTAGFEAEYSEYLSEEALKQLKQILGL